MKISIAQIGPKVGDFEGNYNQITEAYKNAVAINSDIMLLPEMCITGYNCQDLLYIRDFLALENKWRQKIIEKTCDTVLLLPSILVEDEKLYCVVYVCSNSIVPKIVYKYNLPNYGVFDETRYFSTKNEENIIEINGIKIGILLCYDLWNLDYVKKTIQLGAEILFVVNASPYEIGKFDKRLNVAKQAYEIANCPVFYCNQAVAHDGIVFDGRSFVYNNGLKLSMDIYKKQIEHFEFKNKNLIISNNISQKDIIHVDDEIYGAIIGSLKSYIEDNGFKKVILGLSGGIDSSFVTLVAADSIGAENVHVIMMPSRFTSQESMIDAKLLAEKIGCKYEIIPIDELYQSYLSKIDDLSEIAKQNLQARIRGNILMSISNSSGEILLSTGNKSETATGYTTLYGDMCGAFNPIKDLYKTDLYRIAGWRNKNIPISIDVKLKQTNILHDRLFSKSPSAELTFDQKDIDILPEYKVLDQILYLYIENNLSINEIVEKGFNISVVEYIISLVKKSEFKRKQSCIGSKISTMDFDKSRRCPLTSMFQN